MTKIIALGPEIVAVAPFQEGVMAFKTDSAIIQKASIVGYEIVDLELPPGVPIGELIIDRGMVVQRPPAPAPAEKLNDMKVFLVESVDSHIAGIYAKWMRFEAEYVAREDAARAFAAAGYVGDPGVWVTSFATSAGKTNEEAANVIIAQADGLRAALEALGALRMKKYSIQTATSVEDAQVVHDQVISQANAIAEAFRPA